MSGEIELPPEESREEREEQKWRVSEKPRREFKVRGYEVWLIRGRSDNSTTNFEGAIFPSKGNVDGS